MWSMTETGGGGSGAWRALLDCQAAMLCSALWSSVVQCGSLTPQSPLTVTDTSSLPSSSPPLFMFAFKTTKILPGQAGPGRAKSLNCRELIHLIFT